MELIYHTNIKDRNFKFQSSPVRATTELILHSPELHLTIHFIYILPYELKLLIVSVYLPVTPFV